MSVLKSVKNRFQTVQDDLKASFKTLTSSNTKTNPGKILEKAHATKVVNYDAGAGLLDRFQNYWAEIHQQSEENAKCAKAVDKELANLLLFEEQKSLKFQQLSVELSHVQFISQDIQNLHGSLAALEVSFRKLESDLEELDDICEEVEFQRNCKMHREQLKYWEDGRVKEMRELRVRMSQEHVKKVQACEAKEREELRLKQEAFEEAFMSDMDQYRKLGKIERSLSSCSSQLDVADIELDADNVAELDEFLNVDDTVETVRVTTNEQDQEHSDIKIIADEDITAEIEEAMKYESPPKFNNSMNASTC
jgi:hypothetical protein